MLSVPVNKCKRGTSTSQKSFQQDENEMKLRKPETVGRRVTVSRHKKQEKKKERQRLSCKLNCCGGRTEPADRLTDAVPSSNSWPFVTRSQAPRPPSNCLLQLVYKPAPVGLCIQYFSLGDNREYIEERSKSWDKERIGKNPNEIIYQTRTIVLSFDVSICVFFTKIKTTTRLQP